MEVYHQHGGSLEGWIQDAGISFLTGNSLTWVFLLWHCLHLGPDRSLVEAALCTVGCLEASLASTRWMPVALPLPSTPL